MSKYSPLRDHLLRLRTDRWDATFGEIEDVLGFPLPPSAYRYPAWWSNEVSGRHVQKIGWLGAGFRTSQVDIAGRRVTFTRHS